MSDLTTAEIVSRLRNMPSPTRLAAAERLEMLTAERDALMVQIEQQALDLGEQIGALRTERDALADRADRLTVERDASLQKMQSTTCQSFRGQPVPPSRASQSRPNREAKKMMSLHYRQSAAIERLTAERDALRAAIVRHRENVWGSGPVRHDEDEALYAVLAGGSEPGVINERDADHG